MTIGEPINIFSGATGLGGALTNPTELARRKGCVDKAYSIRFKGRDWVDVETAYHVLAQVDPTEEARDALMVELIAAKFRQHPELLQAVEAQGGSAWLCQCTHFTQARSERAQSWEGAGMESRFIRNLVAGFDRVHLAPVELGQQTLF
jgi:hypothetical protein